MKKLVCLFLSLILSMIILGASATETKPYAYLDGMTLDDMLALQTELETRIKDAKLSVGESDPSNLGMWEIKYYVDEFKQPTSEGYITSTEFITGTFSNSATTNSELLVIPLIDKDNIAFRLVEYGRSLVKNSSSSKSDDYDIVMLDSNGEKHYMNGYMYAGGDRVVIEEDSEALVLAALRANASVSFSMEENEYSTSSYLFTIPDTSYFQNAYDALK